MKTVLSSVVMTTSPNYVAVVIFDHHSNVLAISHNPDQLTLPCTAATNPVEAAETFAASITTSLITDLTCTGIYTRDNCAYFVFSCVTSRSVRDDDSGVCWLPIAKAVSSRDVLTSAAVTDAVQGHDVPVFRHIPETVAAGV